MAVFVWQNAGWVLGLEASDDSVVVQAYRPGRSLMDPVALYMALKWNSHRTRLVIEVQDIGGNGSSDTNYQGIGIGHSLVNLAIQYLRAEYGKLNPMVSGRAYHGEDATPAEQERRRRFIGHFGVTFVTPDTFLLPLNDLRVSTLPNYKAGPPVDLHIDRLKVVEGWPA